MYFNYAPSSIMISCRLDFSNITTRAAFNRVCDTCCFCFYSTMLTPFDYSELSLQWLEAFSRLIEAEFNINQAFESPRSRQWGLRQLPKLYLLFLFATEAAQKPHYPCMLYLYCMNCVFGICSLKGNLHEFPRGMDDVHEGQKQKTIQKSVLLAPQKPVKCVITAPKYF